MYRIGDLSAGRSVWSRTPSVGEFLLAVPLARGLRRGQRVEFGLDVGLLADRVEEAPDPAATWRAELVHLLRHRRPGVTELAVAVVVHRPQRLVDLDELPVRQ